MVIQPEALIIVGAALVMGLILLRFARQIARFLLAAGALAVAGLIAWALIAQATASRRIADTAHVAVAAQARTDTLEAITVGFLVVAVVAVLGLAIYCYARWKLAERRLERQRQGGWTPGPNALWGREQQPQPSPYALPSPTYYAPYPPPPPPNYYLPAGYYSPAGYPSQYPMLTAPEGDEGEWWAWFEG